MSRVDRDPVQGFSPAGHLLSLITGYWISQAIRVAAELGIADLLDKRGRPIDDLARTTNSNPDALYRLMRALAASGVFAEAAPREFKLTPMGALLKRDMPGNLRDFSRFQGDGWHWNSWGALDESVRSGRPARFASGSVGKQAANCFDYLATQPESAAIFNAAMTGYTTQVHAAVAENYPFGTARVVMDVGGGHGALLALLLDEYPHLRGVLFDRESVVAGARQTFAEFGVADRARVVGGDFFAVLPDGADITLLCAIIHDWDDEHAASILRGVARAMPADGRVLIVDNVIPDGNEAHPGKLIDLEMLLMTGGRERTHHEFEVLLGRAGLRIERVIPTAVSISIIEARAA
jgi:O-methyltransferase domain/Dimerisation domain